MNDKGNEMNNKGNEMNNKLMLEDRFEYNDEGNDSDSQSEDLSL